MSLMNKMRSACLFILALATASCSITEAAPGLQQPHDWTIEIRTKPMPQHFEYTGSSLKPVVKADMQYYHRNDPATRKPYESLWYGNNKSIGLERKGKLDVPQGDNIAIEVIHSGEAPSIAERKSAAKAMMTAFLEVQMNKNMVSTVRVPMASFDIVANQIQEYNFHPAASENPNEEINSDCNIFLESVPAGRKKRFTTSTKDGRKSR